MTEYDGADVVLAALAEKWDASIIAKPSTEFMRKLISVKLIDIAMGNWVLVYEVDETNEDVDLFYETEEIRARVTIDIRAGSEQNALLLDKAAKKAISVARHDVSSYGGGAYRYAKIRQRLNHSNRAIGLFHFTRDIILIKPLRTMDDGT
jgi:hypothetical protein